MLELKLIYVFKMGRRPTCCCASVFVFSCDQAALWMVFSVCLSVRLSVCLSVTPFWLCSHHHIIMKLSGVFTTDQGNVHTKGQGQTSKVKVTEVTNQLSRFRTVTPYDDEMIYMAWCCLGEVPYCFSRSSVKVQGHTALKIVEFDPDWAFPDCNSSFNSPMGTKYCTQLEVAYKRCLLFFKVIRQISRSHGSKNRRIWPRLGVSGL